MVLSRVVENKCLKFALKLWNTFQHNLARTPGFNIAIPQLGKLNRDLIETLSQGILDFLPYELYLGELFLKEPAIYLILLVVDFTCLNLLADLP
jgi:hypothetical protein